ncbi:MAG TPA: phosphoglycerate dehydrogenase [Bacteroidia bacterium]|nr:phosphoglycerate dehydrogenase [Bacteroidia bacterium]
MESKTSYPKEKIKILLLEGVHPAAIDLFHQHGYTSIESVKSSLSESELIHKISNVHLLGLRSKTQLSGSVIRKAEKLLAAGAFCIGTNQIDLKTATSSGIAVFNSPYSNTRSVAEMVIGLSIVLMRRIPEKNALAHLGGWDKSSEGCNEVRGKTLGIVGYGHIGSQVSVLAESIGMKVIFYDIEPKLSMGNAMKVASLDQLLKHSDIVTLHVPGSELTKNLIDVLKIKKMKRGSVLINLSRGDVVDLKALKDAIQHKHILGAGIDVFNDEPQSNTDKFKCSLQGLSNVVLTPHIGGSTVEAQENIGIDVATKMISFLETGSSTGSLTVPALSPPVQQDAHRLLHIHKNVPGVLSEINGILSGLKVNILGQYLKTNSDIGYVVLDVDRKTSSKALSELQKVKQTIKVRQLY